MLGRNVLNFHNLYGEPDDIINFLNQLNERQIENVTEIVYLIDLRAGIYRKDEILINYTEDDSSIPKINLTSLVRIFKDIKQNNGHPTFLNVDGSLEYVNPASHISKIHSYPNTVIKYNTELINNIAQINNFSNENNINIYFITPVMNDVFLKSIDLSELSKFYSLLLIRGVKKIGLYYYIKGISDVKNKNGEYISFVEKDHINQFYFKKWLFDYILTDNKYIISNQNELALYIKKLKFIQEMK